jgi:drug/metabolite transporter (DMT)-like permease
VLALLAYIALSERGRLLSAFGAIGRSGLAVAGLMAVASGAFIIALNYTSVANVLFMQAIAPILAAALGTLLGEPVPRRTWFAMAVALTGVGLMVGGPGHPHPLGALLSILMSVSFAGTLVITRHRRDVSMAPATCISQVIVLLASLPLAHTNNVNHRDFVLLVGLGVGQIGLGLVFLTIGARLIQAAEVALLTLLEVVLGPLWVWIALAEQPATTTISGGLIVLAAVAIQTRMQIPDLAEKDGQKPESIPPPP